MMSLHRYKRPRAEHAFVGTWHITGMELWDDDYVNMERQIDRGDRSTFRARRVPARRGG